MGIFINSLNIIGSNRENVKPHWFNLIRSKSEKCGHVWDHFPEERAVVIDLTFCFIVAFWLTNYRFHLDSSLHELLNLLLVTERFQNHCRLIFNELDALSWNTVIFFNALRLIIIIHSIDKKYLNNMKAVEYR